MAIDISSLAIQIKSEGITKATQDLKALAEAAKGADKETKVFISTANQASNTRVTNDADRQTLIQQKRDTELYNNTVKQYVQAQSEAIAINRALIAEESRRNLVQQKRDYEQYIEKVKEANKAHQEAEQTLKSLNGHGSIWNNTLKSMAVAATAYIGVNMAKGIIAQGDAWQMMQAKLKLATGSSEEAKRVQTDLYDLAQKIRIPLEDSAKLYTRMSIPIAKMGKSAEETKGMVESMGLALKLSGATAQEASSVMLQFSQSMNAGRLNGGEFNAVAEGAPIILRAIEEELRRTGQWGENTTETLKKMGSEGKISVQLLSDAMAHALPQWRKDFESLPLTVDGAMQRLKNAWYKAIGEMSQSTGLNERLAQTVMSIEESLPKIAEILIKSFIAIYDNLKPISILIGSMIALNLAEWLIKSALAFDALAAAIAVAGTAMTALSLATLIPALLAIGGAIGYATAAWIDYKVAGGDAAKAGVATAETEVGSISRVNRELIKQLETLYKINKEKAVDGGTDKFAKEKARIADLDRSIAVGKNELDTLREGLLKKNKTIIVESMEATLASNKAEKDTLQQQIAQAVAVQSLIDAKVKENEVDKYRTELNKKLKFDNAALMKDELEGLDKSKLSTEDYAKAVAKIKEKYTEVNTFKKTSLDYDQKAIAALKEITQAYEDLQKYGLDDKRTAGEKQLIKLEAELEANIKRRSAATKNGTLAQLKQEEAIIRSAIATEKLVIAEEKKYNSAKQDIKLVEEDTKARENAIEQAKKEADVLEQAVQNHGKLAKSKEEVQLQYALEEQAVLELDYTREREMLQNEKLIEQLQRTITFRKQLEEQAMTDKAAKKYEADWQAANKKIGDGLYEALSSNGSSFVKKLVKDMKEVFARLVLSPIIQPISAFGASLLNPMAASAIGAGASGSGGIGQITSLASLGKSMYDGFASGFSNISAGYTNFATSGVGQFLGLGTGATMDMEAFSAAIANGATAQEAQLVATQAGTQALTGFGQTVGIAGEYLAGITGGLTLGKMISGKYSVGGINAVNVGTAIGAFGGGIGAAIGGAIGGLVNRAFGMGDKEVTGARIAGTLGTSDISRNVSWKQDGGWFRSDRSGTDVTKLATSSTDDQTLLKYLNDTYAALKTSTQDYAKALGINAESIATRSDQISVAVGKTAEESQANIVKMFKDLNDSMAQSLMGGLTNILKEGESAADGFARLAVEVTSVDAVVKGLGLTFSTGSMQVFQTANATFSQFVNYTTEQLVTMKDALIQSSGGLEAFLTQSAYFAQNFLSEAEKIKPSQDQVAKIFDQFHITNVTTIEDYKKLVQGIDLSTESGRAMYAALMLLAPTFKQVADYSGSAADSSIDLARALADTNKSIQDQIDALLKSSMTTEQIRAAELTGVDASTAALLRRLYALQDEKAATEAASAALEAAASRARAVADERYGLETQLLQEEGKTDELRKRELDKLDPSNQELQKRIWALQDEKEATAAKVAADQKAADDASRAAAAKVAADQKAADDASRAAAAKVAADQKAADDASRAAEQAASAAKAVKDAWQSITNTIMDEVRRIRGLVDEQSGMGFAEAQAKFATTTAQARAGDQEAAKLLPSLSQALLTLAEKNARTAEELSYIRAMTANSLAQTAGGFSSTYGVSLPSFDVGTDSVPHDMIAQIHAGEEIVPAAYTGKNNSELVTEIKSLKEEVSKMRTESNAQQQAIAISSAKTAKILTQNDFGQGILVTTSLPV